jgi:hypothetical protein
MYLKAFSATDSYFGMYANGDILFSEDFVTTMCSLKSAIDHGVIKERMLLVGKRLNHGLSLNHKITSNIEAHTKDVLNWAKTAALFQNNAQDFFAVTRATWNWNNMPKYVIGRTAYDNCLVTQAVKDSAIDTIDASLSVHAVHQSGKDGNFAGHRARPDSKWNHQRCRSGYMSGTTDHCKYYSTWHEGKVSIRKRGKMVINGAGFSA